MKKILFIAAITVLLFSCGKKGSYTITGDIVGLNGVVTLKDNAGAIIAETTATDGKFSFEGIAEEPSMAIIANETQPIAMLFLEPGKIMMTGSLEDKVMTTGTKANDSNTEFNEYQYSVMERLFTAASDEERDAIVDEINTKAEEMMNANLDNFFGLYLLSNLSQTWDSDRTIESLDKFSKKLIETKLGKEIREQSENKKRTEIGSEYVEISLPDKDGKTLSLSSYIGEGKYVLLDFWASWCNPCMNEVPYLLEAYNAYKDKGFTIFGVSLDRTADAWVKAMTDNKMDWANVSMINDEEKKASADYAVQTIPANFLIGPDGKIIAKNLRGEELQAKIAELLSK